MDSSRGSGWLPELDRAASRCELLVPRSGDPDWTTLPGRPGVAVFEGSDGAVVLIAATADLRDLAKRRLGAAESDAMLRPGATSIRGAVRKVIAMEAASSLEADAVYLRLAREHMPDTHRIVSERWRAWFVHADADAPHPQLSKTNLLGPVAPRSASVLRGEEDSTLPRGVLIGPIAEKDAAGRLVEQMTDAFDLCRYHHLLAQAPRAVACAYKEMGRCPAPCDGSEPMDGYRQRLMSAFSHMTGDRETRLRRLREDMNEAAASHDFERAAALKQSLARLEALDRPAFRHMVELRDWRVMIVLPSRTTGSARCVLFAGARLGDLGTLNAGGDLDQQAARTVDLAMAAVRSAPPIVPTIDQIDTIAVVSRWMHTPDARRRGRAIPFPSAADPAGLVADLVAAVRKVARPSRAAKPKRELEEREIEVLPSDMPPIGRTGASGPETPGTHSSAID